MALLSIENWELSKGIRAISLLFKSYHSKMGFGIPAEILPKFRIGQRETEEGFKIAFVVANIVSFLTRTEPNPKPVTTLCQHQTYRVGNLDFVIAPRFCFFNKFENFRRKNLKTISEGKKIVCRHAY